MAVVCWWSARTRVSVCVPLLRAACLLPSNGRELLVCPAGAQQPQRHKAAFIHLLELLQHVCLLTEEPQKRYRPPPCKTFWIRALLHMYSLIDVRFKTAVPLYSYFHLISLYFASTNCVALWWVNYSSNYNCLFMSFFFFLTMMVI